MRPWRLGLAALVGCTSTPVFNSTNNFTRASDVAFVCLELPTDPSRASAVRPLSDCTLNAGDNGPGIAANLHLHALVTQSERGEVAVVDLATTAGVALVDNAPRTPGFSFLHVGPNPTAIAADTRSVWVACEGDRRLYRMDPALLRQDVDGLADGGNARFPDLRTSVALPGAPRDVALDEDVQGRHRLYVSLPDRGTVAVYDVEEPTAPMLLGEISLASAASDGGVGDVPDESSDVSTDIQDDMLDAGMDVEDASTDLPDASTDTPDAPTDGPDARDGAVGLVDGGAGSCPVSGAPRPLGLAVDTAQNRVYVSDERSCAVHVLDGASRAVLYRLELGVPSRALALTGRARAIAAPSPLPMDPSTVACGADPDHCQGTAYLYALGPEGGVYVLDLERRERVRANRMPDPNPDGRLLDPTLSPYRVAISTPVVALTAMNTREFAPDPAMATVPCRATVSRETCPTGINATPAHLRGVFVGALLRTGSLQLVDVDDYDTPCRRAGCGAAGVDATVYRFLRHAPRAGIALDRAPRLTGRPAVSVPVTGGERMNVGASPGTPAVACADSRGPNDDGTACTAENFGVEVTAFAAGQGTSTPTPDPYRARNESWLLTWEGILPGLDLSGGQLLDRTPEGSPDPDVARTGRLKLRVDGAAFCARGVLVDGATRDLVTLVDDPRPTPGMSASVCERLFGSGTTTVRRDLRVFEAYDDHLLVDLPEGLAEAAGDEQGARDAILRCFPQATRFQVRASNQWLAVGSRTGYEHAVRADAQGLCVVDRARQDATDALSTRCLLARVPLARRTGGTCATGRVCLGELDPSGRATAARTPIFANPYLCLQVFPGVRNDPVLGRPRAETILRGVQLFFTVTGAYEALRVETGMFPQAARFAPWTDRFYIVDTGATGLVEYRLNPIARARIFN
ncbi:MAG: hypothetical protein HY909_31245 [Deltaproteobacteria bacterium]|nr:hypothetical protein [Deltaproteobacteria bacterium]